MCILCTDLDLAVEQHPNGGLIILGQRLSNQQSRAISDRIHDLLDLDEIFGAE
ncbi:hypothetical protein M1247_21905 [Mycobacterium sp. 21AC1]|uniref:hypothetical protein n=1 Tax=[Mycobacterium] appelbergii TaxID=2939269 RepID=UPI002938E7F9|nr:hypothetical protein [Mycobacterium sp. 21AC1]MDV3127596.1 hypothetical protein [Mycobacterium sp. 21AC1]